ncbi:hypothetical protein F441_22987, partial [Phytophthora nicotianae CJ01A1]
LNARNPVRTTLVDTCRLVPDTRRASQRTRTPQKLHVTWFQDIRRIRAGIDSFSIMPNGIFF